MKYTNFSTAIIAAAFMVASCGQKKEEQTQEVIEEVVEEVQETVVEEIRTPNIVEVAVSNDQFTTLVAAVTAADLVEALSGEGPFTVFAPTNDAFGKLPEGTVESLVQPDNKETLTGILTYHVVSGKFESAAVIEAITSNGGTFTVETLQGGTIDLSIENDSVVLTDAKGSKATVIIPDVAASNGVIHAIDAVVMPQ